MSGAAWINIMTYVVSVFLALTGLVHLNREDYHYRQRDQPSTTETWVLRSLFIGGLVAYVVLLVFSIRMGPSSPVPTVFSPLIAGFGCVMAAVSKMLSSR